MDKKNQMLNHIEELKRLATKKRGVIPNSTSKNFNIAQLTEDRKKEREKIIKSKYRKTTEQKIVSSKYSRSVNPVVLSPKQDKVKKNSYRDLNLLPYKSSIVSLSNKKIKKLNLPPGCFNAGLTVNPNGGYICVYRLDEYSFVACFLDEKYDLIEKPHHRFKFTNCADPRLIWVNNNTKLLMVYSSISEEGLMGECIRGTIIMDLNISNNFIDTDQFRISPKGEERHKNWMPFIYEDSIFLVSNVLPHKIYQFNLDTKICKLEYEHNWFCPWPIKESLRGNTNIVRLDDGNYLGTFHTAVWINKRCHYDNGTYIFEGKPPFKVLKCSNKTYLPAEDAVEPHFRKWNSILCVFPVGMVIKGDKVIISYGDNDSCVKILETTLKDLENLMLEVY